MISQVLNRDFVLRRLEEVRRHLAAPGEDDRRSVPYRGPDLSPEDAALALDAADAALRSEAAASSGQPGFVPPPPDRRSEEPPSLDDSSFFSRDGTVSNLQSAVERFLRDQKKVETARTDRRRGAGNAIVTDEFMAGGRPDGKRDDRRALDKFSKADIRWISSLFAMGIRKFRDRHPFPPKPAEPLAIGNQARLVLVGDWGSGVPRARKVAREIRRVLDEGLEANREQHLVHLGDVYYAGWEYEYRDRFLAWWPVEMGEEERILSWNLNGNHDMYAGGHAFFDYALKDQRFARQQGSSWFSFRNDHWTILGLDTSWQEHGLEGNQGEWVLGLVTGAPGKTMLLSHHQLFSAYEPGGGEMLHWKIEPVLKTGRVRSWFWGHEHRCVLYEPHDQIEFARCIGHGGVPVYMTHGEKDPYPAPATWELRDYLENKLERWALFGFAVLDFDGPEITVRYIDEDGKERKRERIS